MFHVKHAVFVFGARCDVDAPTVDIQGISTGGTIKKLCAAAAGRGIHSADGAPVCRSKLVSRSAGRRCTASQGISAERIDGNSVRKGGGWFAQGISSGCWARHRPRSGCMFHVKFPAKWIPAQAQRCAEGGLEASQPWALNHRFIDPPPKNRRNAQTRPFGRHSGEKRTRYNSPHTFLR